jgi:hypothetical protein
MSSSSSASSSSASLACVNGGIRMHSVRSDEMARPPANQRAHILVSEILDSELLGEGRFKISHCRFSWFTSMQV